MKKRIEFVDISKSLAIFFIVLGHALVYSENCLIVFKFLYSFHVMMFFMLSGYTFSIKNNQSFKIFVEKKFIRIMIPYFIWSFIFLGPYILFGNSIINTLNINSSINFKHQIINIIYGIGYNFALKQNSSLWFLPALFTTECLFYFIIRFVDKGKKSQNIIIMVLLIVSIITSKINLYLPWGINSSLTLGFFFYLGYIIKSCNILYKNLKNIKFIFLFIGSLFSYLNKTVFCIDYNYGNIIFMLISSTCLSLFFILIAFEISKNKQLEFIGQNTMGILIFHKIIILFFQTKAGIITSLLTNSNIFLELFLAIIISLISIGISLCITEVIKKVCPMSLGIKK